MPIVSVVLTTFDRPQFLKEAMESVLQQELSDLELVVVDDASPGEETARVVASFSDARIRYLRNKTSEGGTASLNRGLRIATGKYIAILDDDDAWIDREKLKKQAAFLESHPDVVLVGTNAVIVESKTKKELARSAWAQGDEEIRETILRENPLAHSSVMYLRETALGVGGYDESLLRGKDYDLMLALGRRGKMAILPDHALMYRETVPEGEELITRRLRDAKATAAVLWKHRREYPRFFRAYSHIIARVLVFQFLTFFPALYVTRGKRS